MRIGLVSLGCPKNLVDSEVMLGLASAAGHELTNDPATADVLVVNTCAFIDSAKQESIDTILEMARHKTSGACQRLVVTGCLAERYREELAAEIPEIDAVLGTGDVPRIVGAIEGHASVSPLPVFARTPSGEVRRRVTAGAAVLAEPVPGDRGAARHRAAARPLPTYLYDAATPRVLTTPGHYAYVKIAEGCDYNCAFCVIPTLRGAYRSRTADSVVAEAEALAARGVRELVLISQDTTFYGIDRQERGALARLLRRLDAIDGLTWIRLLYLYPTTVTAETLDAMAACEKVCRYIDMPLQHAADTMLKRMRRPGTRRSYETLVNLIRARLPGVTLRTTFITGFPGETDEEFAELVDFVHLVGFDHVGVFTYSHEAGSAAGDLEDDVPDEVKAKRRDRLMRVQREGVRRRQSARVGEIVTAMVDGPSREHELVWQGRLASQAPEIDPVVYFTDCEVEELSPGAIVRGTIVEARDYDLVVRPLREEPSAC
ncbi:MAG: 30S ribosomal protein S12 methylthiotransferase RimO [Vicinamibacterales bacterium]